MASPDRIPWTPQAQRTHSERVRADAVDENAAIAADASASDRAGAPGAAGVPGSARPGAAVPQAPQELALLHTLTRALDRYFVDPLLGLVLPGAGDLIGSVLGLAIVAVAVRRRMSPVIIARMLLNLALDAALGLVPLAGDLADVAFRANERNLALLSERLETRAPGRATARDWLIVAGAALVFVAVIGLVIYAIAAALRAVF